MSKTTSPAQFIRQVRQEASKVTWSSRKDIIASTLVVLVMVIVASVLFGLLDRFIFWIIQLILGF